MLAARLWKLPAVGQRWAWRRRKSSSSSYEGTVRFGGEHVLVGSVLTRMAALELLTIDTHGPITDS